jgi:hypothetical protein
MKKKSREPIPRLRPESIELMAEAAGFAPACIFESSVEFHEAAVAHWRRRSRRGRLANVSPSFTSLGLALLLVLM